MYCSGDLHEVDDMGRADPQQVRARRTVSFETFDGSNDFLWRKWYVENELSSLQVSSSILWMECVNFLREGFVEHRDRLRPEKWSAQ